MNTDMYNDDLNERHSLRLQAKGGERTTPEQRAEWAQMRIIRQAEYEATLPIRQSFGMRKYILPTLVFIMALGGLVFYLAQRLS